MLSFPQETDFIFEKLKNNGFQCYAVGGCVRDLIMGKSPSDFDFTTDATPDEIAETFSEYKTIDIGKDFGTIAVVNNNTSYEITTFRTESGYSDNRHPDKISFSNNIIDDLSRRDFTVNSIAFSEEFGIVDPFGGIVDISNKIIRTTGDAEKRFSEDALRVLRGLRFSAKLGFNISKETANAMHLYCENLSDVHPQRLKKELEGLLLTDLNRDLFLEYKDVLSVVIPEIKPIFDLRQNNPHHIHDVWMHTVVALENSPADLEVRMALLFHDVGKAYCHTVDENGVDHFKGHQLMSAEICRNALVRFGFSSEFCKNVSLLIEYHDERFRNDNKDIKRVLGALDERLFFKLMQISRADTLAQSDYKREEKLDNNAKVSEIARQILEEKQCFKLSQLAVNGTDLKKLDFTGPEIGDVLRFLLDLVISGKCLNDKSSLIDFASQIKLTKSKN